MNRAVMIAGWIAVATAAWGQSIPSRAVLSGVVYDSTAGRPLAGAAIEVANAADPAAANFYRATSDAQGRYEIRDVIPGRYVIGFMHPLLDSLAIEPAPRLATVGADPIRVDLAVPSFTTISRALCPTTFANDSLATVFGRLYDAQSLNSVSGGKVTLRWRELIFSAGAIRQTVPGATVVTRDDGMFAFCGVPANSEVGLFAARQTDTTDMIAVTAPGRGVVRRDLFLRSLDSTAELRATVRGLVRSNDGRPLANASVNLLEGGRVARTDSSGRFELRTPAAGTRQVEVRLVGYVAEKRTVDLYAGSQTSIDVRMLTVKQMMDTVRVVATRIYDKDTRGFQRRRRTGMGYYITAEDAARQPAMYLSDLLRRIPGVYVSDSGFDRILTMRGNGMSARCRPDIYLDGQRLFSIGMSDLDMWVHPNEIAGVEVYNSGARSPVEFTTLSGCGSVVIWTQPPARAP